ncbi:MAG: hypothetical protein HOK61_03065 [Alphaproteobacteria bacterium]|jgi:cell division septation protein DedD|nr:hypothetical protein [Alphaproteobacteria bacterium]
MVEDEDRREPNLGTAEIKPDIEERAFGADDGSAAASGDTSYAPADGEGRANETPRAKLMPMWLLIGAVALAGVVWYFSDQADNGTGTDADVPLISAEDGPVKVRPEEPGGLDVPNRDKYVYKSLTDETAEPDVEQLLPPPEEPVESIVEAVETAADEAAEAQVAATSETEQLDVAAGETASPEEISAAETPSEPEPEAASEPVEVVKVQEASSEQPAPVEPAPAIEAQAEPEAEPAKPTTASSAAIADNFRVQFASARSEDGAESEWRKLQGRQSELLAGLNLRVVQADLGDKGVWYRARIGPFSDRASAGGLCDSLKKVGVDCFVAKN